MTKPAKSVCAKQRLRSDWAEHPPSLIRVFDLISVGCQRLKVFSCGYRRLLSDSADAYSDQWVFSYRSSTLLAFSCRHSHCEYLLERIIALHCEYLLKAFDLFQCILATYVIDIREEH